MLVVAFRDYQILRSARDTVGKDGDLSWTEREAFYRQRDEAGVGPAKGRVDRQKNNLTAFEAA